MAVTVAGVIENLRTGTSNPWTWSHTAGTTSPRGVLVAIMHGTSETDHVVSVTYGGLGLTRVQRNVDTAAEEGAAEWWFLGTGVPTGTQTVSVALSSATSEDLHGVSVTLNGADNLEVVATGGISQNAANPAVTLAYGGRTCMAFAAFYSGHSTVGSIVAGANCTKFTTSELPGNFTSACLRQTTAGSSNFTIGATVSQDDVAFAAVAVSEVQPLSPMETIAVAEVVTVLLPMLTLSRVDGISLGDFATAQIAAFLAPLTLSRVDGVSVGEEVILEVGLESTFDWAPEGWAPAGWQPGTAEETETLGWAPLGWAPAGWV